MPSELIQLRPLGLSYRQIGRKLVICEVYRYTTCISYCMVASANICHVAQAAMQ